MKQSFLIWILFVGVAFAQNPPPSPPSSPSQDQSQSGPGPGIQLPPHTDPPKFDLSALQTRALELAEKIRGPAQELFQFLAILALMWAGYQLQFQGLREIVGSLLWICFALAAITNFRELSSACFAIQHSFKDAIGNGDDVFLKKLSAMVSSLGASISLLSLSGIAGGVALFLVLFVAVLLYLTQVLFQSVLLIFGPLAIATLAFRGTRGIFWFWFKTWIAILLIPIGWDLAGKLVGETVVGGLTPEGVQNFLLSAIYILWFGVIYLSMPIITLMIVNAAGGAMAAGMPSFASAASSFLTGQMSGVNSRGSEREGASRVMTTTNAATGQTVTTIQSAFSVPASVISKTPDFVTQRAMNAQKMHQDILKK